MNVRLSRNALGRAPVRAPVRGFAATDLGVPTPAAGPRRLGVPSGGATPRPTAAVYASWITPAAAVGADDAAASEPLIDESTAKTVSEAVRTTLPVLQQLVDTPDSVAVLRAKLANHRALRDRSPEPLRTFYANKVTVLEAKLRDAALAERRAAETRASQREWSTLGKGAVVGWTAAGVAGAILLLALAARR